MKRASLSKGRITQSESPHDILSKQIEDLSTIRMSGGFVAYEGPVFGGLKGWITSDEGIQDEEEVKSPARTESQKLLEQNGHIR